MSKQGKVSYRVIFDGRLAAGRKMPEVKKALLRALHCKPEDINPMFIGRPVVIGQDLPEETASQLVAVLEKAGLVVHKETNVDTAQVAMEVLPPHRQAFIQVSPAESMQHGKHYCEVDDYLTFNGRLGRARFMGRAMGTLLFGAPLVICGIWLATHEYPGPGTICFALAVPLLLLLMTVVTRRLHDLDLSGLWALIYLLLPPLMGYYGFLTPALLVQLLATLFLTLKSGSDAENSFDFPPPPDIGKLELFLACAFPLSYFIILFYAGFMVPKWIASLVAPV